MSDRAIPITGASNDPITKVHGWLSSLDIDLVNNILTIHADTGGSEVGIVQYKLKIEVISTKRTGYRSPYMPSYPHDRAF